MSARMRLRRADDGRIYLDRWGWEWPSKDDDGRRPLLGIFVHRMEGPDPGLDLHDHPWWFGSLVLWGGYVEERARTREAPSLAFLARAWPETCARGVVETRRWLSWRSFRLDECHRVTGIRGRACWTFVVHGPWRRGWGFYLHDGWMDWRLYEQSAAGRRRGMEVEISNDGRPERR